MTSTSGKKEKKFDWLTGEFLKFDDNPEYQWQIRNLCKRLGIEFDRNTGLSLWAEIGLSLARDQPEFQYAVRKRKGRPPGARKSLGKWSAHDRVFVRLARLEAEETGVPVRELISSAVYVARKFHETGKPPVRDKSRGLWEYLTSYKRDKQYSALERRLNRCNDAYDAKLIEELLKQGLAGVALTKTKNCI